MTTSPTSYLQTLAKDEAIAFVASLQKVKIHLSHDLTWMSQQVQQKTVQIHGIETLLSEAAALGLVNAGADTAIEPAVASETTTAAIADSSAANGSGLAALPLLAVPVTLKPAAAPTEPTPLTADLTPPPPVKSARGKRGSQSTVTPKNGAPPALKAKRTLTNTSQSARESTQPFVRSQFQDQSMTDAIGAILKRSRSPLSADDIMEALYDGLAEEAYRRAKNSVTNILSVGRGKGKWKSTGRGLYANNAVAIS